jgi:hypothetical protein
VIQPAQSTQTRVGHHASIHNQEGGATLSLLFSMPVRYSQYSLSDEPTDRPAVKHLGP